ncbi:signal peptide protein [Ralstonia pickettii DTP0602]|nr:signal peptide protein [Ralstonia pickettii DTP0602]
MTTQFTKRIVLAIALVAAAAGAQAGNVGARDPYSDGARSVQGARDPFTDGARSVQDARDPFTDGARNVDPYLDGARA